MRPLIGRGLLVVPSAVAVAVLAGGPAVAAQRPGGPGGTVVSAPCVNHDSVSGSTFDYNLCGLPDLDQHRKADKAHGILGLPDDGVSWCAPTAAMNAFAYFASHGLPALPPGDRDWTVPANYNPMTKHLEALGDNMSTNPAKGTTGLGFRTGIATWLKALPLVGTFLAASPGTLHQAPTLNQMAAAGAAGAVVIPHLLFIKQVVSGSKLWYVQGGHILTMSSAESPRTIGVHDPATPTAHLTYQAPYREHRYAVTPISLTYVTKAGVSTTGTFLRIDNYRLDKRFNEKHNTVIIASFATIAPETIHSWGPPGSRTTFLRAFGRGPVRSFLPAGGQAVIDLALDPVDSEDFYTTAGSSTIWGVSTASGTSTAFTHFNGQPELVGFADGSRTLFVSGGGGLTAYSQTGQPFASAAIHEPTDALAVEQATGDALALSARSGLLQIFDSQLHLFGAVMLPQATLAGTGRISIAVHRGVLYIHRGGEGAVALVALPGSPAATSTSVATRFIPLPRAAGSQGLAVDDAGRIFVRNSRGRLAVYGPTGKPLRRSPFNGRPLGSQFAVNASYASPGVDSLPFDTPIP